jgi:hypothetical protein
VFYELFPGRKVVAVSLSYSFFDCAIDKMDERCFTDIYQLCTRDKRKAQPKLLTPANATFVRKLYQGFVIVKPHLNETLTRVPAISG